MAYPKWECTPEILERVADMAAKGVTEASIARNVGLSPTTFSLKKKEFPELEETIKNAASKGEEEVVGYLWNIIRDPKNKNHFSACLFYLKTKHRWRETDNMETAKVLPASVPFKLKDTKEDDEDIAA